MTYRIDACPAWPDAWRGGDRPEVVIAQVGCGGTGGFLAEAIGRLLLGIPSAFVLVDHDRVEERNVARQSFTTRDIGGWKAQVLAERLARQFGREVGYSVLPYDRDLHARVFTPRPSRLALIVGCVDNAAARRAVMATLDGDVWHSGPPERAWSVWYLDVGNARNSGQLLFGNVTRPEGLRGAFNPHLGRCRALPAPGMQRPDLLTALSVERDQAMEPDCAEAIMHDEQSRTVNQVMAALAASHLEQLLAGTARGMATYVDLDDGTLRVVPAEPKIVAALAGLHVNAVAPLRHGA